MGQLESNIDWFEFTIKGIDTSTLITEVLQLHYSEFNALNKGRFGYNAQLKWECAPVYILFNQKIVNDCPCEDSESSMGVHVIMSGAGCRAYNAAHGFYTLINNIQNHSFHKFTRIDLAIDDFNSHYLSFDVIHQYALQGWYTSRWNRWSSILCRQTTTNEFLGRTIYFGSQKSSLFCRIYDKNLEQHSKFSELEQHQAWTRLELVYRHDRAQILAQYLVDYQNIGVLLKRSLNGYIRFLEPHQSDTNKARWQSAPWWDNFLNETEKLRLTMRKENKSIEEMKQWIRQQISPTLAAILKAHEGEMSWLYDILNNGQYRLKQKHLDAIALHLRKNND